MRIVFKNKNMDKVSVCFEPNGLTVPLSRDENIELNVEIEAEPAELNSNPFKIEIEKQDGGIYIIFWEEYECRYRVTSKGKVIIG